jgi:hypothetical protein
MIQLAGMPFHLGNDPVGRLSPKLDTLGSSGAAYVTVSLGPKADSTLDVASPTNVRRIKEQVKMVACPRNQRHCDPCNFLSCRDFSGATLHSELSCLMTRIRGNRSEPNFITHRRIVS